MGTSVDLMMSFLWSIREFVGVYSWLLVVPIEHEMGETGVCFRYD